MSLARLLVLALALICGAPALADISQWSTTPGSNATITDGTCGNINWAEGQAPSTVNDSARATMANIRCWYQNGGWTPLGHTTAYVGATQFKTAGVDTSAYYHVGRRVRAVGSTTGTIYGRISAVAFSTDTTVTVQWDTTSTLANEALTISVGFDGATGQPTPSDFIGAINSGKGAAVASATSTDIWAGSGNLVHVTGTTTITSFATAPKAGAWRLVIFDGALTLTHGASAIVIPGGANVTTAANDMALVVADTTTKHMVAYFKADGTALVAPTAYTPNKQVWTSTGTFSKSSVTNGATHIIARCWGAGGGGGGGHTSSIMRGAGGGGGGYAEERIAVSALASSEDVTIGAGGTAGTNGTSISSGGAGGDSTFGTTPFFTAAGGAGGAFASGTSQAGGAGGAGSNGDTNLTGQTGGLSSPQTGAGTLGEYLFGAGGNAAGGGGAGAISNVAVAGQAPGGGGSGGNHVAGSAGAGAAGRCEVTW